MLHMDYYYYDANIFSSFIRNFICLSSYYPFFVAFAKIIVFIIADIDPKHSKLSSLPNFLCHFLCAPEGVKRFWCNLIKGMYSTATNCYGFLILLLAILWFVLRMTHTHTKPPHPLFLCSLPFMPFTILYYLSWGILIKNVHVHLNIFHLFIILAWVQVFRTFLTEIPL